MGVLQVGTSQAEHHELQSNVRAHRGEGAATVQRPESQVAEEDVLFEMLSFGDKLIELWHVADTELEAAIALATPVISSRPSQCASPFGLELESHLADFEMFKDLAFY
jgi:hypothetical protein